MRLWFEIRRYDGDGLFRVSGLSDEREKKLRGAHLHSGIIISGTLTTHCANKFAGTGTGMPWRYACNCDEGRLATLTQGPGMAPGK